MSRHGIREPSDHLIRSTFQIKLQDSKLEWMKEWKNPFVESYADDLVMRGVTELRAAGKRLRHLLNISRVRDKTYEARSTAVRRAGNEEYFCLSSNNYRQKLDLGSPFVPVSSQTVRLRPL